jgi:hypothetical protein
MANDPKVAACWLGPIVETCKGILPGGRGEKLLLPSQDISGERAVRKERLTTI